MNRKGMLMISPGASTEQLSGLDDFFESNTEKEIVVSNLVMAKKLKR